MSSILCLDQWNDHKMHYEVTVFYAFSINQKYFIMLIFYAKFFANLFFATYGVQTILLKSHRVPFLLDMLLVSNDYIFLQSEIVYIEILVYKTFNLKRFSLCLFILTIV